MHRNITHSHSDSLVLHFKIGLWLKQGMLVKQKLSYTVDIALFPLLIEKTTKQLAEKGMFFSVATNASNRNTSDGCFLHRGILHLLQDFSPGQQGN